MFRKLDKSTLKLIMSPFHPKTVELQPEDVRIKHSQVSEALVAWLHQHKQQLYGSVGKEYTDSLIYRYQQLRDLAAFASMIPKLPEV